MTAFELQRCAADRDGECVDEHCPQLRDGEPMRSGRSCPVWLSHIADDWEHE